MENHKLKTVNPHFQNLFDGLKTFEVRFNDRNFKVGDFIECREYLPSLGVYTGRIICFQISHILEDSNYCKEGYVILSIKEFWKIDETRIGKYITA